MMITVYASNMISPDTMVIPLTGELDLAVASNIRRLGASASSTPGIRVLRFDLAGVTFLDSTAIGAFVDVHRHAADKHDVTVRLDGAPPRVYRIFEIAGLVDMLAVTSAPE